MKKTILAVLLAVVMTAFGQIKEPVVPQIHVAKHGESAWKISRLYYGKGTFWRDSVFAQNEFLQQRGIQSGTHPGWDYVNIKTGELVQVGVGAIKKRVAPIQNNQGGMGEPANSDLWWGLDPWTWLFMIMALIFFILFIISSLKRERLKDNEKEKDILFSREKASLKKELEETKNKLPIEAPVLADAEWLGSHSPVGAPIPQDDPVAASDAIAKVYGKKPDLIAQAKVSTVENATKMKFSHERTATTGLDNVNVYLGWDWSTKKRRWVQVGMWAGACTNGFESNPDKVKKNQVFSKIVPIDKNHHPIISTGKNVPAGVQYPMIVKSLVFKYHKDNIVDLKKIGVLVEIPQNLN